MPTQSGGRSWPERSAKSRWAITAWCWELVPKSPECREIQHGESFAPVIHCFKGDKHIKFVFDDVLVDHDPFCQRLE